MIFQKLLSGIDGGRILDVGCGTGQFTQILIESLNSYESMTGIDIEQGYLGEARRKFQGRKFQFMVADSAEIPFQDESFDFVAISKALHHLEDPGRTLGEMKRVLRSGGYFLVNEMHRDGLNEAQESHLLYHHLRADIDRALGIPHNQTCCREDLIRIGMELGLKDSVISEFNPDPDRAKDPSRILEFSRKMDAWMPELEGLPRQDDFIRRVEELKQRFRRYGISHQTQLVIFGRK
jgi:SAM-dependent methyltransferase